VFTNVKILTVKAECQQRTERGKTATTTTTTITTTIYLYSHTYKIITVDIIKLEESTACPK